MNKGEHVQDDITSPKEVLREPQTEEELLRRRRDWEYVYCVSPVAQCDDYAGVPRGGVEEDAGSCGERGKGRGVCVFTLRTLGVGRWADGVEIHHSVGDWIDGMTGDCGVGEGCCCWDKGIVSIEIGDEGRIAGPETNELTSRRSFNPKARIQTFYSHLSGK